MRCWDRLGLLNCLLHGSGGIPLVGNTIEKKTDKVRGDRADSYIPQRAPGSAP